MTSSVTPLARPEGPVRVMHLLLKLGFGGAEGGVVKLVNGLDRSSVVPSICSCWPADGLQDQLQPDVTLYEMNRKRLGNDYRFVGSLWRLLRRVRPHVLHTHGWATLLEGLVAARMASVPIVVHGEHGTMEPRHLAVQRFLWGRADAVTAVSSRLTQRLADTVGFPVSRIVTIRNGVDTERFSPVHRAEARRLFDLPDSVVAIVAVGRFLPVKDQATLIDALALLRDRGVAFRALIAGDGPLRADLSARIVRNGLAGTVQLLGNRSDVEQLLACADVFAQSSVSEGLSNTVLEAMATGLPVVATDVGGTDELVQHGITGLLVPASNPQALSTALASVVHDSDLRQRMGRAGVKRATSEFTLERMITSYQRLYTNLVRTRRRPTALAVPHADIR